MFQGWICPICNSVYAPYFPWCFKCNNFNIIQEQKQDSIENAVELIQQQETKQISKHVNEDNDLRKNKDLTLSYIDIKIPTLNKEPTYPMSKKYPDTKIFLTGIGHAKERAIKRSFYIPYVLDSIIEFPIQPSKLVREYFDKIKQDNTEYLLDSGALTYLANPKKPFNLNNHLKQYCFYINEFDIKNFFELDLDVFLSIEEIENIRRKIYLETHKKPLIVYHPERGHDYWINMCKENEYVAIGGLVTGRSTNNQERYKELSVLVDEAHSYNTLVHGLGFTPLTLLNNHTVFFDSVDSTSWNSSKNGYAYAINEKDELIKIDLPMYFNSIEAQDKNLEIWAKFSQNYKGKER